jgi:DNA-binding NarL/FixJ family response regulator
VWLAEPPSLLSDGLAVVLSQAGTLTYLGTRRFSSAPRSVGAGDIVLADPLTLDEWSWVRGWATALPYRLVAFTACTADTFVLRVLSTGVHGYLAKSSSPEDVVAVLSQVVAGRRAVAGSVAGRLAVTESHLHGEHCWPGIELGLTRRESEVLVGLGEGSSNADLARDLVLGEETVRSHLRSLYRKLGVRDRCAAVATGFRLGVLD